MKNESSLYKQFRATGHTAAQSKRSAKTVAAFRKLEAEGSVRMRAEPEEESYLDTYGEPEAYTNAQGRRVSAEDARKELISTLDRYGCWWTCSEVLVNGEWIVVDSCGMHTGYADPLDPLQNCYVVDEMQAAIEWAPAS